MTQLQARYQLSRKKPVQYRICVNPPFKTGSADVINYKPAEEALRSREPCRRAGRRCPAAIWRPAPGGGRGGAGPRDASPKSPRPDDRAVQEATSGLRPSREQIPPRLTRAPRHGISRIPAADLVFLIVLHVSGGAAAAAWPACRGRSWRSPVLRVPELAGGSGKIVSVFSPCFGT